MVSRRRLLAGLSGGVAFTLSGCIAVRQSGATEPDGCPAYPDASRSVCGSPADPRAKLTYRPAGGATDALSVRLSVTDGTLSLDPEAHALFDWRDDHWRLRQLIDVDNRRVRALQSGDEFEWLVTFDFDAHGSTDGHVLSLAPFSPIGSKTLAIPARYEGKVVSYGLRFSGEEIRP